MVESDTFKEYFKRIAQRDATNETAAIALQSVVLPIAIALLGIVTTHIWSINPLLISSLWLFLLIVYFLVWMKSHPLHRDIYGLLIQKQADDASIIKLKEENDTFKEIVDDLSFKNISSFALRAMSIEYIKSIKRDGISKEYFCEMLDEMLSPFYMAGDAIFGFGISEKWSIGVYLYDRDNQVLRSVWRKTSGTHPSKGRAGRDWRPGEGHVGKTFLDRRPILTGNANEDAVAQLCRARTSKWKEHDSDTYVSFASVPIAIADDDGLDPYGVLVVTSNVEDRLSDEAFTEMLMHAAETVAVILELAGVDTNCLVAPNHCMTNISEGAKDDQEEGRVVGENG